MITLFEKEFNGKNYRLSYEDSIDGPYLYVRFDLQKNATEWEIKVGHQVEALKIVFTDGSWKLTEGSTE